MKNLTNAAASVLLTAMQGRHGPVAWLAAWAGGGLYTLICWLIVAIAFYLPLIGIGRLLDGRSLFTEGQAVLEAVTLPLAWLIVRFVVQNESRG